MLTRALYFEPGGSKFWNPGPYIRQHTSGNVWKKYFLNMAVELDPVFKYDYMKKNINKIKMH